jgi:hypothetical protein
MILGKTTLPSDLSPITVTASGDGVAIRGEAISDPDIVGYEVRIGSSWSAGLVVDFRSAPFIRLSGIKPGSFTFWMAAKDNAGLYSPNPVSAGVQVFYPPAYSDKNSWSWNFSTGSHSNTQQTTYGGNNCLKCSHTGSVLSGTWVSPAYDLGSIKTVRVWGDFIADMISSGLTWASNLPSPAAWTSVSAATKTWSQIFSSGVAGNLSATIEWGETAGVYTGSAFSFHILAPEFTARYVRVSVTIVDPALDANLYLRTLNMKGAYWS